MLGKHFKTQEKLRVYNDGRISWSGLAVFISNNIPRFLLLLGLGGMHSPNPSHAFT